MNKIKLGDRVMGEDGRIGTIIQIGLDVSWPAHLRHEHKGEAVLVEFSGGETDIYVETVENIKQFKYE